MIRDQSKDFGGWKLRKTLPTDWGVYRVGRIGDWDPELVLHSTQWESYNINSPAE
jgi:hypothetical protein